MAKSNQPYLILLISLLVFSCSEKDPEIIPGVYEGDVLLSTQEQVVEFGSMDYHTITGDLRIASEDPSNPALISDLSSLNRLRTINGNLAIRFTQGLEDLTGLENISRLDGSMTIDWNADLVNLRGIESITEAVAVQIVENESLQSLDGLNNLRKVTNLTVARNRNLTRLTQLGSLTEASFLVISSNPKLESLEGLERLTICDEILAVLRNDLIENLTGLNNLESVGLLDIGTNINLSNINALSNLRVAKGFSITRNAVLRDLGGLQNINVIFEGSIDIWDNPKLESLNGLNTTIEFVGQPGWTTKQSSSIRIGNNPLLTGLGDYQFNAARFNQIEFWDMPLVTALPGLQNDVAISDLKIDNLDQVSSYPTIRAIEGFVFNLSITNNGTLRNLDDIARITSVSDLINVSGNALLTDLCGLSNAVNEGVYQTYEVNRNGFNPAPSDFEQGNCSN